MSQPRFSHRFSRNTSSIRYCVTILALASLSGLACAQMPPKEASQQAIAKYPELAQEGSPFNNEFRRRWRVRSAEDPGFQKDKNWPLKLATEVAEVVGTYAAKPEIEFRVLLIIKRISDTYHPLFLPVRSEMTDEDVTAARHCFEIQTPDIIHEATNGKVRFIPTVVVSAKPLRVFSPSRLDSAEYSGDAYCLNQK